MKLQEIYNVLAAIIILFAIISFPSILKSNLNFLPQAFIFSTITIILIVAARKFVAHSLDADAEHEIWSIYQWGIKPHQHFSKPIKFGIILPLLLSIISFGIIKFPVILTFEARALKRRAAKRFGFYSFTEITEFHNAVIAGSGIIAALVISLITYFLPANFEYLAKISAYYALVNLIPISKLDGAQIFYGSRTLWLTLFLITIVFTIYALFPFLS
ncbi:MAG: hypothetical protein N3D20_01495 [Candidatus Pacearchaeota archaeon]|nr:hypothetical protein [Candidatus Pacearchaeota archaeon]